MCLWSETHTANGSHHPGDGNTPSPTKWGSFFFSWPVPRARAAGHGKAPAPPNKKQPPRPPLQARERPAELAEKFVQGPEPTGTQQRARWWHDWGEKYASHEMPRSGMWERAELRRCGHQVTDRALAIPLESRSCRSFSGGVRMPRRWLHHGTPRPHSSSLFSRSAASCTAPARAQRGRSSTTHLRHNKMS